MMSNARTRAIPPQVVRIHRARAGLIASITHLAVAGFVSDKKQTGVAKTGSSCSKQAEPRLSLIVLRVAQALFPDAVCIAPHPDGLSLPVSSFQNLGAILQALSQEWILRGNSFVAN